MCTLHKVIKVFLLNCTSLRLSLFQVYGTPVFEEDDNSSAAAAATNGGTRSRGGGGGQNFKKKVSKTSLLHSLDNEDDQTFGSPAFYSNETTGDGASGSSGQNGGRERPILSIFKMLNGNRSGLSVKDVFHAQRDYPALDLGSEGGGEGGRLMPPPPIPQAKDDAEDDEDDEEESDEQDEEDEDDNLLLPDPRFRFRPPEDRGKQQQQQPGNTWNNMAVTSGPVLPVSTTATTTTTRTTTTRATTATTTVRTTATTERSTTTPAWKIPIMPLSTPHGQQQLPYDRYSWDRDHQRGGSLTDIHSPSYVDTVYDTLDTSDSRHGYHGEVNDLGQQRDVNDVHDDARHYPRNHFFPMSIEPSQQRKEVLLRWVTIV